MGRTDTERAIGALQVVGGALELVYGGGIGLGGGGGYLIGSGIQNLSGSHQGSGYVQGKNAVLGDLLGSVVGVGPSTYGNIGGVGGRLIGGGLGSSIGATSPSTGSQGGPGSILGALGGGQGGLLGGLGGLLGGGGRQQAAPPALPPPVTQTGQTPPLSFAPPQQIQTPLPAEDVNMTPAQAAPTVTPLQQAQIAMMLRQL